MRTLGAVLLLQLGGGLVCACGGGAPARPAPKNLLLISMDTVRADHLGLYGYERDTTPNLARRAARGVVFEACSSASSWTVPAHLTLLTGLDPATHGCIYYREPGRLNEGFDTMARMFARKGYRTGAFTGGGFMSARHGMDIGFETFAHAGRAFRDNLPGAVGWLEDVGDEPFFLFLHGYDAHRPYLPPAPFDARFRAGDSSYPVAGFGPGVPRPTEAELDYVVSQYDGEIAYVDHVLETFFQLLERTGRLADTLVMIVSDHGDEFYEHGGCDHIHTLYDELVQVPWIVWGPGVEPARVGELVGTIDVLPTLVDAFQLEPTGPLQGASRWARLGGAASAGDAELVGFTGQGKDPRHLASVRTPRWKLVTDDTGGLAHPSCEACRAGTEEGRRAWLYDLEADPAEQHDVADQHPEVLARLRARLAVRIQEGAMRRQGQTPRIAPAATEAHLEQLEALGYAGD